MSNGKVDGKIIGFPGVTQVPTVGQRLCPFLSQTVIQAGQLGTITVQCSGVTCRLWELCSGITVGRLIDAVGHVVDALEAIQEQAENQWPQKP